MSARKLCVHSLSRDRSSVKCVRVREATMFLCFRHTMICEHKFCLARAYYRIKYLVSKSVFRFNYLLMRAPHKIPNGTQHHMLAHTHRRNFRVPRTHTRAQSLRSRPAFPPSKINTFLSRWTGPRLPFIPDALSLGGPLWSPLRPSCIHILFSQIA